ncbi:hypothetical protein Bbelb_286390 [Branchiostoma belcheri]|nr:hypothetical protein Bbelb_286390 [Branchiostoma belcheri]
MAAGDFQTVVAVFLSVLATLFTLAQGRVSAMNDFASKTERSVDSEAPPSPTNVHINSRNLYNEVCWDYDGGKTSDDRNYSGRNSDDRNYGGKTSDDRDHGGRTSDDKNNGGKTSDDRNDGGRTSDDRNYGGKMSDDRNYGGRTSDDRNHGGRTSDDRNHGGRTSDDRNHGGRTSDDRNYGGRTSDDRNHGRRTSDDRNHGGKTSDDRNLGGETSDDRNYGGKTSDDRNVTFDAQYIDDKEYKTFQDTWTFISDCRGVSGPCCRFFDEISVRDEETGRPLRPRWNGWWVRVRAVSTLGPSRWTTSSEWFSPYKHTLIGPPDIDVIAKPANEDTSSVQQLRDLDVRFKHPATPYYHRYNQETMATMGDFDEEFFVFYNVSYWLDGYRENARDFVVEKEECSITGLRPGAMYCVKVTGFVKSIWAVQRGLPSEDVCQRTAEGKPSIGPTQVSWLPLPATNCSAATRSFRAIRVWWSPPPASDANGVITKYKVTITRSIGTGEHVTIRETVASHIQLSDLTTFHTYTVQPSACTSAGCTPGEQVLVPAHVTNAVAPTHLRKAEVTSEKIAVTWFPPENEYDCVDVYRIRYLELSSGTLRQVTVKNTTAVLPELQPGSSYNVSVSAVYKRYSHSSESSPVESPYTPWVTVSTGPQTTDIRQTVVFAALGGCFVVALIVTLYFPLKWNSGKRSEEDLYDFTTDADVLSDIKLHPKMSPITSRRQTGQREKVDSWANEMRALANFESLVRIHADLWVAPKLESLGRSSESVGSDPDSTFTGSTALGDADALADDVADDDLPHSTQALPSDYLSTLHCTVISHGPIATLENGGNSMEGDYVQHALAATPRGWDTEMQPDAIATKQSNDYVSSESLRASEKDIVSSDYVRVQNHPVAPPSDNCDVDKHSDRVVGTKSNDSGHVTAESQKAPIQDNIVISSDYVRVQHHSVATPSDNCNADKHPDTVLGMKVNETGYITSESKRAPVKENISSDYVRVQNHSVATPSDNCDVDKHSDTKSNDSGHVTSEIQRGLVKDNISSDYVLVNHHSVAPPSDNCNADMHSDTVLGTKSNDSGVQARGLGMPQDSNPAPLGFESSTLPLRLTQDERRRKKLLQSYQDRYVREPALMRKHINTGNRSVSDYSTSDGYFGHQDSSYPDLDRYRLSRRSSSTTSERSSSDVVFAKDFGDRDLYQRRYLSPRYSLSQRTVSDLSVERSDHHQNLPSFIKRAWSHDEDSAHAHGDSYITFS